jgi:ubiquinone/menaquinone biosynthesis C-methylase UbiE
MAGRLCPWWLGYFLASPIRKIWHDPMKILAPNVKDGMTALDIGPGMGYFTIPMARLVGERGRVIAVDVQEKMLRSLRERARKAGFEDRVETRLCPADSLGIDDLAGKIDFALTFAVLHETPDIRRVLSDVHNALRSGGMLLISEPSGHVNEKEFEATTATAHSVGFQTVATPLIKRSHSIVVKKV